MSYAFLFLKSIFQWTQEGKTSNQINSIFLSQRWDFITILDVFREWTNAPEENKSTIVF